MIIVGLTGGIGSGKTTVLNFFKELGADCFIADEVAKSLMQTDRELISGITSLFGERAYSNGGLNRTYIASIVFNNKEKLEVLNKMVHPKVKSAFETLKKSTQKEVLLYEAAILFESGSDQLCDYTVTVYSDYSTRIERIMKRDGISEEEIKARIKNQSGDMFKIKKADFVIRNEDLNHTKQQVFTIFDLITRMH